MVLYAALMEFSGLSDALETIYGGNTVIHILSGKAISRALRGHFIVQAALMIHLLRRLMPYTNRNEEWFTYQDVEQLDILKQLNESEVKEIESLIRNALEQCDISTCAEADVLNTTGKLLQDLKSYLCQKSRTAKLWINYIDYIDIVKRFIRAERCGDWSGHL